jgi:hypothetical protein
MSRGRVRSLTHENKRLSVAEALDRPCPRHKRYLSFPEAVAAYLAAHPEEAQRIEEAVGKKQQNAERDEAEDGCARGEEPPRERLTR